MKPRKRRQVTRFRNPLIRRYRRLAGGIERLETRRLLACASVVSPVNATEQGGVSVGSDGGAPIDDCVSMTRSTDAGSALAGRTVRLEGEFVEGTSALGVPGTPIHNTIYDLQDALGGNTQPWQMTFDDSTQTVWLTAENGMGNGGPKLAQFDPATGRLDTYDLLLDPDNLLDADNEFLGNSHGTFFDFNSHLTPRVWVVHRARNSSAGGLSYLDIDSSSGDPNDGEIVSYKLADLSNGIGDIPTLHAVFVDTLGAVWATSLNGERILEIRIGEFSDSGSVNLDSQEAEIVVHEIPDGIKSGGLFRPHALEVVVDDQTGERFVWIVAGEGGGRTALLRPVTTTLLGSDSGELANDVIRVASRVEPGIKIRVAPGAANAESATVLDVTEDSGSFLLKLDAALSFSHRSGEEVRGPDRWVTWDFTGKEVPSSGGEIKLDEIRGTFTKIDDNETPGDPFDDTVVVTMPVGTTVGASNPTTGVVHVIDPRETLVDTSRPATVDTYQIARLSGTDLAAPNQPYADRSGAVFFIDRIGSIGRFHPSDEDVVPALRSTLPTFAVIETDPPSDPAPLDPIVRSVDEIEYQSTVLAIESQELEEDQSLKAGVNQYQLDGGGSMSRGAGAFRGFLNNGNVLYASLSQDDKLSVSIFAESARRQMSAIPSPFEAAGITQARMAFQVIRDGSLILTARGDGVIGDDQENLLRLLHAAGRLNQDASDFAISGEASAMTLPDGTVHVMGRSRDAGVVVYTYTPPVGSNGWAHQDLFDPDRWTVFLRTGGLENHLLAEDTVPIANFQFSGNSADVFSASTAEGHWLAIPVSPAENVIDLTAESGMTDQGKVYSVVGTTVFGDTLFGYGTNQTGDVVQYSIPGDGSVSVKLLERPNEDTRLMRSVQAITIGDQRHLFGTDGVSRLVHWELSSSDFVAAENITNQTADSGRNAGYFQFQTGLTGRVLTDVAPVVVDGTIFVYGTNGKELVEFIKPSDGPWRVGNLTNDTLTTFGENTQSRVSANSVFGAPSVYVDTNGGRHVLQINVEGEVVEYFTYGNLLPGDEANRIHTQNVNFVTCLSPQRLMLDADPVDDACSVSQDPPQQTIWRVSDTVESGDAGTGLPESGDENSSDESAVDAEPQNESELLGSGETGLEAEGADVKTPQVMFAPNPPVVPESSVEEETESELESEADLHPLLDRDSVQNASGLNSEVATSTEVVPELATSSRDVDGNGMVTPHDALLIINELTRMSDRAEGSVPAASRRHEYNLDVSGDQRVSLLDALLVINFLIEQKNDARAAGELARDIDDRGIWDGAILSLVDDASPTGLF